MSNYYMQCLHDIAFYSDVDAAIQSTISLATSCMNELTLSYWPAQYLCNDFPTKDFHTGLGFDVIFHATMGADLQTMTLCVSVMMGTGEQHVKKYVLEGL